MNNQNALNMCEALRLQGHHVPVDAIEKALVTARVGITIDLAGAMEKITPAMMDQTRDLMIETLMNKIKTMEEERKIGVAQATILSELEKDATPGTWGQFSALHGPWKEQAKAAFAAKEFHKMDTSHHMSTVINDKPKRLAEFTHAADAAFAEALVNAYRAGRLVVAESQPDTVAENQEGAST